MRVRVPGGRIRNQDMRVLENTLRFGPDGWAQADHLTDEEVQRCIRFHFRVEHTAPGGPVKVAAEPEAAPEAEGGEPAAAAACPECGRSDFKNARALRAHRQSHGRAQKAATADAQSAAPDAPAEAGA